MENEVKELSVDELEQEKLESFMQMLMKTKEVYNRILQEYFKTPAVIRMIYMDHFKVMTKEVKNVEELKAIMEKELALMRAKADLTPIEKIEFRLAKKIYKDVVEGKGLEFDLSKPLSYSYDGQVTDFEDITMGFKDSLEDKKNVQ